MKISRTHRLTLNCLKAFIAMLGIIPFTEIPLQAAGLPISCVEKLERLSGLFRTMQESRSHDSSLRVDRDEDIWNSVLRKSDGSVDSRYDPDWKTRVYFTSTAKPNRQGRIPYSDPDAKALYLFFHGSGTARASGRNFIHKMEELSSLGYSAVGFDLPHHADGPVNPAFDDPNYFMEWMNRVISSLRNAGQPVYLVGHSFGPDVIAEYLKRHPTGADGALLVSPAGFNPELKNWSQNYTERMKFGGDVPANELGGQWAEKVSNTFEWKQKDSKLPDPTVANPKLKVKVISGDREEYVPGPVRQEGRYLAVDGPNTYDLCAAIRQYLRGADCVIAPGVGHYIFEHRDETGQNLIQREILALNGKSFADTDQLLEAQKRRMEARTPAETLGLRYSQDRLFRSWLDQSQGSSFVQAIVAGRGDKTADEVLKNFYDPKTGWLAERFRQIDAKILETRETDPSFYQKHQKAIEALRKQNPQRTEIFPPYFERLRSLRQSGQ